MGRLLRVASWCVLAALCAHTGACGGGDDDDGAGAADAGPDLLEPAPPAGGQQLTSTAYTLAPGEEKYLCYTFYAPADPRAITKIDPLPGELVHHTLLVQTLAEEDDGPFECPVLIRVTWAPIWASGVSQDSLELPAGVGFKVPGWTQYLVQYHLLNATDRTITERSALNLTYAAGAEADALEPAGIFALGSFSLAIPPGALDFTQSVSCAVDRLMHVFAVLPHMHQLGEKLVLEHGATEATAAMAYQIDPWQFGDQPMDPMALEIADGDFVRSTCTWNNPGDATVEFGESSTDEMCFTVLFYWPAETSQAGCVD